MPRGPCCNVVFVSSAQIVGDLIDSIIFKGGLSGTCNQTRFASQITKSHTQCMLAE